jgi:hypothetical protein
MSGRVCRLRDKLRWRLRRNGHDPDLTQALDAQRRNLGIGLIDKDHLDVLDVRMRRHVIFAEAVVHPLAQRGVGYGLFEKAPC